jgi:ParB family chromosome partitioning protein
MDTAITNATEYRNVPLALLTESTTNPRRIFEEGGSLGVTQIRP